MAKTFNISFDTRELEAEAQRLEALADGAAIARAQIVSVKEVTQRTYDTLRKDMNRVIALDDQYLRTKLTVSYSNSSPTSEIRAVGDLVVLARYSPKLILKPVVHPGRSKGDKLRGIPPGLKASGVSVQVSRGVPKAIPGGFLVPLRRGTVSGGNGMGIFTRDGGKIRQRYGPAVYQLFRVSVDDHLQEIADDLQATTAAKIESLLKEVL